MGEVYFYHLTRQSINEALVPLLNKCLDNNWRVVVRGTDLKLLEVLDEKLWEGPGNEFLPHGLWGGAHDLDQPVLLVPEGQVAPLHDCLICISNASVTSAEVSLAKRVCIIFRMIVQVMSRMPAISGKSFWMKAYPQSIGISHRGVGSLKQKPCQNDTFFVIDIA